LEIPLEIVDCRAAFGREVIDYFNTAYQAGRTPNPCVVCNPKIKFGFLLELARQRGAQRLASGHYARTRQDAQGAVHLLKGSDGAKDQSYFLARLTPLQLAAASFPLGGMTKAEVKQLAARQGLHPVARKESQDICFIRQRSYGEFLQDQLGLTPRPGPIVDLAGRRIGEHPGLHRFTIGQRRGINCPAAEPYYVVRLEPKENRLVVGVKTDLLREDCVLEEMNWIQPPAAPSFAAHIRIRYRQRAVPAQIFPQEKTEARVVFRKPQAAVTPGQAGVLYQGDEVWGSGWIAGDTSADAPRPPSQ
jgi:tRNA-specific 2-thiouridylase